MGRIVSNILHVRPLCFLFAPKQLLASLASSRTTSAAIAGNHAAGKDFPENLKTDAILENQICYLSKLPPRPRKKLNAEGIAVFGSYSCICRRCWTRFSSFLVYSMTTESLVTYFWKPQKSTFVLQLRKVPRDTFRRCKTIKRRRRFRFLGQIPHILVDDGALFPFSLSGNRNNQRSLKTKKQYDAFYVPAHYSFPGHILKPLTKKKSFSKIIVCGPYCW